MATRQEYVKMGLVHTGKDKKIGWQEITEMEKQTNGHIAWAKMYDTGGNHGQLNRVIDSKVGKSKNIPTMYVAYKDHKKEPETNCDWLLR